jgi:glycogen operon protein
MAPRIWPGEPYPLGATYDGVGTNFSIFSGVAERVELSLFDEEGSETCVDLPEVTGRCWHGYVPGVGPGQKYGYRVHGPYAPKKGQRCNPSKMLLDPYAKAVEGQVEWNEAVFGYHFGDPDGPRNEMNSAPFVPKSVVVNPYFDWGSDRQSQTPLHETVIYEMHVKGFTARHPDIPPELRGTYAGLTHPATVDYLVDLGVTAVELLPVHQFAHDSFLVEKGLRNYWGYNSLAFFAPHNEYARNSVRGQQVQEFKQMVKVLHEAGLEVILDVVYTHTGESSHLGPTLSLRGIDNAAYYRLSSKDRRYYIDFTGTGNTLNVRHPHVLQLIMDSLRYWVLEMHVDGFRFDLAATLAREPRSVDRLSAFFDLIQQDPVVSQVKLIAEPWDMGEGGYQVGKFPPLWSEWNDKYRNCIRDYWRSVDEKLPDFAHRISGSSDLYQKTGRRPNASVNFVTSHDGFTLHDLVSYSEKHNEANGEENRDGENDNRSWNCGVEGPTGDPGIISLRTRQKRNMLAALLLSQGVPMVLGGDEIGRTQNGNNNPYCQDNEISWYDWESADGGLLEFTQKLIHYRCEHPVFRRRRWFLGKSVNDSEKPDIGWFTPDGREMKQKNWQQGFAKSLAVFLNGQAIPSLDQRGEKIADDSFYVLFNAHYEPVAFMLPPASWGARWVKVFDTVTGEFPDDEQSFSAQEEISIDARSLTLLRRAE